MNLRKTLFGAALLCLFLLASCGEPNEVRTALDTADSLLAEGQPDSAYSLLSSLPQAEKVAMSTKSLMRFELLKARAQNSAYIPFTSDSVMLRVADYYNRHGNANEQMTANYVLGCAYYDMGEAPLALRYFHEACDRADTTATNCDWRTLGRVHVQMAWLLLDQNAPQTALKELRPVSKCALLARDTLTALYVHDLSARAYFLLGNYDSVIAVRERASKEYLRLGYRQEAAQVIAPAISMLVKGGEMEKARKYIKQYEQESGRLDSVGNLREDSRIFYYSKGMFFLETGELDSAEICFRKLASVASGSNDREGAYYGLFKLYSRKHQADSVMRYAQLAYAYNDTSYREKSTATFQQMQALHDYTRHQQLAEQKEQRIVQKNHLLTLSFYIASLLLLAFFSVLLLLKRKKEAYHRRIQNLERDYNELLAVQKDLEVLYDMTEDRLQKSQRHEELLHEQKESFERMIAEKESLAEQKRLDIIIQEQGKMADKSLLAPEKIFGHEIIERLNSLDRQLVPSEMHEIYLHTEKCQPGFISKIKKLSPGIRDMELNLCILSRMGIRPSKIACLLGVSTPLISLTRKRLTKKLFNKSGGAKDFGIEIMFV